MAEHSPNRERRDLGDLPRSRRPSENLFARDLATADGGCIAAARDIAAASTPLQDVSLACGHRGDGHPDGQEERDQDSSHRAG